MNKHLTWGVLEIFLWWMKYEICEDITIDETIRFVFLFANSAAQQGVWMFFFFFFGLSFLNKNPLAQHVQRLHLRYL